MCFCSFVSLLFVGVCLVLFFDVVIVFGFLPFASVFLLSASCSWHAFCFLPFSFSFGLLFFCLRLLLFRCLLFVCRLQASFCRFLVVPVCCCLMTRCWLLTCFCQHGPVSCQIVKPQQQLRHVSFFATVGRGGCAQQGRGTKLSTPTSSVPLKL